MSAREPFQLRGVVHLVRPIGTRVRTLEELHAAITEIHPNALFYHTVQYILRNPAAEELPLDDISAWVSGVVQDRQTAERLSFAVQTSNGSADELRAALLEVLDSIPAKARASRDAAMEGEFVFLTMETVAVPTEMLVYDGTETVASLLQGDASVWFNHLVQEPWFTDGPPPLTEWLESAGDKKLASWLMAVAAERLPIEIAREKLLRRWRRSSLSARVAAATAATEDVRRDAARSAVLRLVKRVRGEAT